MEGLTTGVLLVAIFSLISISYPAHRGRGLAARVCGASFGVSMGAVIGGTFVVYLGYFGVFLLFAILSLLTIPLALVFKEAKT